jgi:uncharacterized protein (TIGR01777 family)
MKSKIILAGGSGFLGQALASCYQKRGVDTVVLTRSPLGRNHDQSAILREAGDSGLTSVPSSKQVLWDAATLGPWKEELEGAMAVVNLNGKSVDCRYNARNRGEILDSRVKSTRVLGEAIAACAEPPAVWLNASTATVYRHTFGPAWDEGGETEASAEAKDRFSVEVAWAWEAALNAADTPRTRKVALRTAMVLGRGKNSVFPVLCRLTRLGLGGPMGSGRQFVSWIHEQDYCRAVEWLIHHPDLTGPINITAPTPVPNSEMMRLLRQVCHTPFGLPATEWMLEIGAFLLRTETELIIKSRRVIPGRLLASGFTFEFPAIREAFEDLARRQN